MPAPKLAFSHVGLYAKDLAAMEAFYTELLGFQVTDRGELQGTPIVFLSRDPQEHHQIVLMAGRTGDARVVNQISFRLESLADLKALAARLAERGSRGVAGDHGNAWSYYAPDPDGNLLEFFVDAPWYVAQPRFVPFDLGLADDEIVRRTEAAIAADPTKRPAAAWRAEFAERLAKAARA